MAKPRIGGARLRTDTKARRIVAPRSNELVELWRFCRRIDVALADGAQPLIDLGEVERPGSDLLGALRQKARDAQRHGTRLLVTNCRPALRCLVERLLLPLVSIEAHPALRVPA